MSSNFMPANPKLSKARPCVLPVPRKYEVNLDGGQFIKVYVERGGGTIETNLKHGRYSSPYNRAIDGFESLVLACASNGVDIDSPEFVAAINDSLQAIENHLGD